MKSIEQHLHCNLGLVEGVDGEGYSDELISQINALGLPKPITANDVYIRQMRLTGDQQTSVGGRFHAEDMPKLLSLCNGAPLLIGHDDDMAPIGRFFGGRLMTVGSGTMIAPMFYWPRGVPLAEEMRLNIDSGVWTEASIGINCNKYTCSECGNDIRDGSVCPHYPGREYNGRICFYWWEDVTRVREGSIVYRGAHPGTGMGMPTALKEALKEKGIVIKEGKGIMDELDKVDGVDLKLTAVTVKSLKESLGLGEEFTGEELGIKIGELTELAKIGSAVNAAERAEALRLATAKAGLAKTTLSDSMKKLIAEGDINSVKALRTELAADVERLEPALSCAKCGSHEISRRVSEPQDITPQSDPKLEPTLRMVNKLLQRE